jgi:RNA polymerase sigma-70 factor (ECF subfamily)
MMPMLASVATAALPAALLGPPSLPSPDEYVASAHQAHAGMTYAVALRATRDPELAEDVTQEAFIKLLTEARAGRFPDNAGAWLYRAVSNLIISRARRAEVARRLAPRLADLGGPDQPDVVAVRRESQAELRSALGALSPDEQMALLLSASGATGLEIAARLGRSHGATRAMMCRARIRLRGAAVATAAAGAPAVPMAATTLPVRWRTAPAWGLAPSR